MPRTTIQTLRPAALKHAGLAHAAMAAAVLTAGVSLAGSVIAQPLLTPAQAPTAAQTPTASQARARAATQSLNAAPAETALSVGRVTAGPPLTQAERAPAAVGTNRPAAAVAPAPAVSAPAVSAPAPRPTARPSAQAAAPRPARPATLSVPDDAATRLLNQGAPAPSPAGSQTASGAPDIGAATPLIRGYYVRGDLNCDQVWPGEGNLAWLSDTSFTLDFGGCRPGQIEEAGPRLWREDQRCETELGGDGGLYSIEYEQVAPDAIIRRARLSLDGSVEDDRWKLCRAEDVPEEARFHERSATTAVD